MNPPLAFAAASLLAALLLAPTLSFAQADYARERRLADEITLPEKFRTPVLDLHGEKDRPGVLDGAAQRGAALRGIRGSGQMQVAGADHFFTGLEGELGRQVRRFLDSRLKR